MDKESVSFYSALKKLEPKLDMALSEPDIRQIANYMYAHGSFSVQELRKATDHTAVLQLVTSRENDINPLRHIRNFMEALRICDKGEWADLLLHEGQRGVTNTKESTNTTQFDVSGKPENKNVDTSDAAAPPTNGRNAYPRGKGRAIIIYLSKFNASSAIGSVPEDVVSGNYAYGNQTDGKSLAEFFDSQCGFYVETIHNEGATCSNITNRLKAVASDPNVEYNMFVCAVLSHGGINKQNRCYVCDYDWKELLVEDITAPFKEATSLAAKPKIFIFNACRGKQFEGYHTLAPGAAFNSETTDRVRIPREAHFLYFYSSVEGYYSFTAEKCSRFVRSLVSTLTEKDGLDVVAAFTDVIDQMAAVGPVPVKSRDATGNVIITKEVVPTPCIVSTLTKALYFR